MSDRMMRLKLQWTWQQRIERIQRFIAWRLPRWLVAWAAVRLITHATQGQYSNQEVPALGAMEALQRWDEKPGGPF